MSLEVRRLEDAVRREFSAARKFVAERAKSAAGNFYYAFIFLPREQREGMEALYAFCRAGDDAADDEIAQPRERLAELSQRLDLCFSGLYCDRLTLALADAVRRFKLSAAHFREMLAGLEADLTVRRYPTFRELRRYCHRVASTVGLHCIRIFGCDTPEARRYAELLGVGMQLTNILRDLKEDYDRGRIYLPESDLIRFRIKPDSLFDPEFKSRLGELVHWEARRARSYFRAAKEELPDSQRPGLFAAEIMGMIYRRILDRIAAADDFTRRIELSTMEKLKVAREIAGRYAA